MKNADLAEALGTLMQINQELQSFKIQKSLKQANVQFASIDSSLQQLYAFIHSIDKKNLIVCALSSTSSTPSNPSSFTDILGSIDRIPSPQPSSSPTSLYFLKKN
ncbi:hypothetical protein KFK09_025992 [Dendrobium nobile]|uniref:Uncharacterized protein n=1 Tax=Dendrobium nobile TaxID=94219 RepID=A0A8T3A7E1_DENNO|nr:hypothetical protein KFK09_025992 [Dendrobium nobile]